MTGQQSEGSKESSNASTGVASSRGRGRERGRVRARGAGSNRGSGYRGQNGMNSMDRSSIQSDRGVGLYSGEQREESAAETIRESKRKLEEMAKEKNELKTKVNDFKYEVIQKATEIKWLSNVM